MAILLNRGLRGSEIPAIIKYGEAYFIPGKGLFVGDENGVPEKIGGSDNLVPTESIPIFENCNVSSISDLDNGTIYYLRPSFKVKSILRITTQANEILNLIEDDIQIIKGVNVLTGLLEGDVIIPQTIDTTELFEYIPEVPENYVLTLPGISGVSNLAAGGADNIMNFNYTPPPCEKFEWILILADDTESIVSVNNPSLSLYKNAARNTAKGLKIKAYWKDQIVETSVLIINQSPI